MSKATQLSQSYSSPRTVEDTAAIQVARAEVGRVLQLVSGPRYQVGAADLGGGILMANGLYANLISDTSAASNQFTALDLVANGASFSVGFVISVAGFATAGDGGECSWIATGNSIAASQTPAMTGTGTLSDANGAEYGYVSFTGALNQEIDVKCFGALGESADYTLEIIAAIAFAKAQTKAVKINFSNGHYGVSQQLLIDSDGDYLTGNDLTGFARLTDSTVADIRAFSSCRIYWTGAATADAMVLFNTDTVNYKSGGGIQGIMIDGMNLAGTCVEMVDRKEAIYNNLHLIAPTNYGLSLGFGANNLGSCAHKFTNTKVSTTGISGNTASGIILWGSGTGGNACFNEFYQTYINLNDPAAASVSFEWCDFNIFIGGSWNRFADFHANDTQVKSQNSPQEPRYNRVLHMQGGVRNLPAAGGGVAAWGNTVSTSRGNGVPAPLIPEGTMSWETDVATATYKNAIRLGYAPSGCRLTLSAPQVIANNAGTLISWTTLSDNTIGDYFTSWAVGAPTRLLVPDGCRWAEVYVSVEWGSNSTGKRIIDLRINGTSSYSGNLKEEYLPSGTAARSASSGPLSVTNGDYFELSVLQNSGGNLNIGDSAFRTSLRAVFW